MSSLVKVMLEMKARESEDRIAKAACDTLRALLILGGAGWESELLDGVAAIAALSGDISSVASRSEVEDALNRLEVEGLIGSRRGKRADPTGASTIEETLYSLKDFAAAMQVFGADRAVLLLRKGSG
ncbi:TPA: hypothetical protein EYP26_03600 [Candidatus Bathyarchaeota archaeon]|nr:hypothetical protein [Candidatus Bathyarchaeota archaeon]